jgi:serine/threonine-protein kinase
LTRFIAVCNTVAYAHSRGIVHRDLKPQNIMLGKYGETLVVDWGLAKPVEHDEAARSSGEQTLTPSTASGGGGTQQGQALGTPAYMSPEQAAGRWDAVGPVSDIYSLGATLYVILTGQAPIDGSAWEAVERAQRGQFVPPRQRQPGVPRALEAICLKAMALWPTARYQTATELATDLERWLADEPVLAYREPFTQKARRWIGRHRTLVTGGVTAVVVSALLLAILAVILQGKNAALADANAREREAREQADASAKKAHETVNNFYTRVSEETLLNQPLFQPLRKKLLADARKYYQNFLQQREGDPTLRNELAQTFLRLARITSSIGSDSDALKYQEQGCALLAELAQENSRLSVDLAHAYDRLGRLYGLVQRFQEARPAYLKSIELWEQLDRDDSSAYKHELAYIYDNMSTFLHNSKGDPEESWQYLHKGLAIMEPLTEREPSEEHVRGLAYSYNNKASLLTTLYNDRVSLKALEGKSGEALLEEARTFHGKAREIRLRLVRDYPNDTKYRHRWFLARSCARLADVEHKLSQIDSALTHYHEARDHLTRLVREEPAYKGYRDDLALFSNQLGRLLLEQKQWSEALPCFEQEREQLEMLVEIDPDNTHHRNKLSGSAKLLTTLKEARQDLEKLQGTWTMVAAERGGQSEKTARDLQATFTGVRFATRSGDKVLFQSTFTLDPSAKPKAIDIVFTEGSDKGKSRQGIYVLEGDTLKVCYSDVGRERPTEFTTKEGTGGHLLFVYRRDQP